MKKIKHKYIAVICLISIYINLYQPISILSQDSLMHYLEIATKNNPTVLQRYAEYEAALQKVPQAGSLPDPELTAGIFLSPMELMSGKQVAEIQLMQMFPWFGVLKNAKDEMNLMAKAKYESFREAKLQVLFDVQRTWNELLKTQQDIRIAEKNTEILRTLERILLARFKAGPVSGASSGSVSSTAGTGMTSSNVSSTPSGSMGGMGNMGGSTSGTNQPSNTSSPSAMQNTSMGAPAGGSALADLYRIQIDISDMENRLALLNSMQTTTKARFNEYLNRQALFPVWLPDSLVVDSLIIPVLAISDSMLARNPMLGMFEYEQQSYEARKKMITRMGYPMIGLGLSYSLINKDPMSSSAMNGDDMIMPMVTISLPIYRKKYKAMQTEANLLKSSVKHNYQSTANALQTQYYEALQQYEDAGRRIKLYNNQRMLAQKSFDIMVKSFSTSGTGLTDVLRVRQQLLDYESKQIEAVSDFNTAIAQLRKLANLNYSETL